MKSGLNSQVHFHLANQLSPVHFKRARIGSSLNGLNWTILTPPTSLGKLITFIITTYIII